MYHRSLQKGILPGFVDSDVVYNMGKLHSRFANTHKHVLPPHFLANVHFSLFEVFFCCPEKKKKTKTKQAAIVQRNREDDIPTKPLLFIKVLDMQTVPAEVYWESMGKKNLGQEQQDGTEEWGWVYR